MITLWHKLVSLPLEARLSRLQRMQDDPLAAQQRVFGHILSKVANTAFGRDHKLHKINELADFKAEVPVRAYEDLFPYIDRCLAGEADVLWPGRITWYAQSSGTTNDRSKFIPVTPESLEETHMAAGKDMSALYLQNRPDSRLFTGKSLGIGGSHEISHYGANARYGDISAVLIENLPALFRLQQAPSKKTALMAEWEAKIEQMARETMNQRITGIVGVPTWTLVLINKIFELRGNTERNLLDVWPHLEVFFHGAVNFEPYREEFNEVMPGDQVAYVDVYNASEGFFACQSDFADTAMLLMADHGVFYEFMPLSELGKDHPRTLGLDEVQLGETYAIIITTVGGLFRYLIGDTVKFTSLAPPKLRIVGRTKHFINAFGEEVVVENAEDAVATASQATGARVADFTAAPIYFEGDGKAGHEWLIEFSKPPDDFGRFQEVLDARLQEINSDYAAKRYKDLALGFPVIRRMPEGSFHEWLRQRGRLGGQNKIPRLSNDRQYVESILATNSASA